MANADPTGGGERAVRLTIPPEQAKFLCEELAGFKADLEDDARAHRGHPDVPRWLNEADAYGRLISGIDAGEILPDDHVRRLVSDWADANDRAEHYDNVSLKHDALAALNKQIGVDR